MRLIEREISKIFFFLFATPALVIRVCFFVRFDSIRSSSYMHSVFFRFFNRHKQILTRPLRRPSKNVDFTVNKMNHSVDKRDYTSLIIFFFFLVSTTTSLMFGRTRVFNGNYYYYYNHYHYYCYYYCHELSKTRVCDTRAWSGASFVCDYHSDAT